MLKLFLKRRFSEAFQFAFEKHKKQLRKGSGVPYITHLMSVAALVMEHGGGEDEAIAALLHDVVEDQGVTVQEVKIRFGDRVADIVAACTKPKVDWRNIPSDKVWETMREGHLRYFEHLKASFDSVRLVSAADKLHNGRHVLADLRGGRDIFAKMKGGPGGTLWYYEQCAKVFIAHGPVQLGQELERVVAEMRKFVPNDKQLMEDGTSVLSAIVGGFPVATKEPSTAATTLAAKLLAEGIKASLAKHWRQPNEMNRYFSACGRHLEFYQITPDPRIVTCEACLSIFRIKPSEG
jgi:hypothetical protein